MRIFNEIKTEELSTDGLDLTLGHLVEDKLFKQHHEATAGVAAKTAEQVADELRSEGKQVSEINGKLYQVLKVYDNGGRHVEEIKPQPAVPAVDAWDEYEDIYIYKAYSQDELLEFKKQELRTWREKYFVIIDRAVWYDCLSDGQKAEVRQFRQELKDITLTLEKPTIPACVQAEIKE